MDKIDEIIDYCMRRRENGTRMDLRRFLATIQPSKPESECNCKGGRHCEVCRKADSVGAGIEKKIKLEDMRYGRDEVAMSYNIIKIADRINSH